MKELSSSQKQAAITVIEKKKQRCNVDQKLEANLLDQCEHKNCIKSFGLQSEKRFWLF